MAMNYGTVELKWQIKNGDLDWVDISDFEPYDDSQARTISINIDGYNYTFLIRYFGPGYYSTDSFPRIDTAIFASNSNSLPGSTLGAVCLIPQPNIQSDNKDFLARVVCRYKKTEDQETYTELLGSSIYVDLCGYNIASPEVILIPEEDGETVTTRDCNRVLTSTFESNNDNFSGDIIEYGIYKVVDGAIYRWNSTSDIDWFSSSLSADNNEATVITDLDLCSMLNDPSIEPKFWTGTGWGNYVVTSRDDSSNTNPQTHYSNSVFFTPGPEPITITTQLSGDTFINVGANGGSIQMSFDYSPKANSSFIIQYSEDGGNNWERLPSYDVDQSLGYPSITVNNVNGLWDGRLFRAIASNLEYSATTDGTYQITVNDPNLYVVLLESNISSVGFYSAFELRRFD